MRGVRYVRGGFNEKQSNAVAAILLAPMRVLIAFTLLYTVALFAYGVSAGSPLVYLYTGINIGLFGLFAALHRWARWPIQALWAISLVGLGNMLGGVLLVGGVPLYVVDLGGFPRYDKLFHAIAAAAMFIVAWEAMKRWAGEGYHFGGLLLWTWLVTMGGGAVVEIAEFVGSRIGNVNIGDLANNALDLVANGVGAIIGAGLVYRQEARRTAPTK